MRMSARAAPPDLVVRCVLAAVAWLAIAGFAERWPDAGDVGPTDAACRLHGGHRPRAAGGNGRKPLRSISQDCSEPVHGWSRCRCCSELWELASAKLNLLPRPFFAAPQSLLEVYTEDWPRLAESTLHSLMLLVTGYAVGASLGFVSGVAIGWSRAIGYWVHPVLRFIGPLARDRLAAAGVLRVSVELERQRVPDRAGDRVSGHRVDLVRRRERQRRLLRRRANAWRPPGLPDPQGRHPGRDAVGVRRALHGPWRDRSRCWSWRR